MSLEGELFIKKHGYVFVAVVETSVIFYHTF